MDRFFHSFFLLLIAPALVAQPVPAHTATIVVTADRIAEPLRDATDSVTVITAEDLARMQTTTVAEALRDAAGVTIVRSGSAGHLTSAYLRGGSSSQLLLLMDGVEINDPFFGGADIGSLLTSGVDRIEIVRGPQSPLYGSQAMAGVVNIVTAPYVRGQGIRGTLQLEAGSLSSHDESVQVSGGSELLRWKLGVANLSTDGAFDNDEFRNLQLNGRIERDLTSASTLAFHAFAADAHTGIPFNGITRSLERDTDSRLAVGGFEYILHASPLVNLEARASLTDRSDAFRDPEDSYAQSSSSDSKVWRAMVQNTMNPRGQTITFGVEHKREDVIATSNEEVALDETLDTTAVYAQDRFELGALRITGGARLDHHSRFGDHVSPRLSAAYSLGGRWRVRAAAGRAFRAPSAGELAYPFYGNPGLDPEISRSVEAGLDYETGPVSIALTAFSTKYDDLISFDPVTLVAANIARATTRGAELTLGAHLRDAWSLAASYTHVQTRDEETGLPLYRRPRNSASVTLSYARDGWNASANVNLAGRRFERDYNKSEDRYNGGYTKVDLAGAYALRPAIQLRARVENALDREYAEAFAFPAPGRTFHAGIRFGF